MLQGEDIEVIKVIDASPLPEQGPQLTIIEMVGFNEPMYVLEIIQCQQIWLFVVSAFVLYMMCFRTRVDNSSTSIKV